MSVPLERGITTEKLKPAYDGRFLEWAVEEYLGCEVCDLLGNRLRPEHDALQVGMSIVFPTLIGNIIAEVTHVDGQSARAVGIGCPELRAILEFAGDARGCWVCLGLCNLKGLERLNLTTETAVAAKEGTGDGR